MPNQDDEDEQDLAIFEELEATRAQIVNYQGLLKELPEIFEHKFNERLKPFLDRQQQLIDERETLLERLHQQLPQASPRDTGLLLPPTPTLPPEPPTEKTIRPLSVWVWWFMGLAVLGVFVGVYLSRHLFPPKGTSPGSTFLLHPCKAPMASPPGCLRVG